MLRRCRQFVYGFFITPPAVASASSVHQHLAVGRGDLQHHRSAISGARPRKSLAFSLRKWHLWLRIGSLEDAEKCRGITWLWSLFSDVVVGESEVPGVAAEPRLLFCLAIVNDLVIGRSDDPDPPVP